MPYSNYGQIGDVWKHLPLLDVLSIEKPDVYYETNAAYPIYQVEKATEKQKFGIGTILSTKQHPNKFPLISKSLYIEHLPRNIDAPFQLYGSPALAHKILGDNTMYILCDLDKEAINSQNDYFSTQRANVQLVNEESIEYTWHWLDHPATNTFMLIDPYEINEPNSNGHTFFQLFKKAAEAGVATFMWYGFQSSAMNEWTQRLINSLDRNKFNLSNHYFALDNLGTDSTPGHPGVPGCGILTANLQSNSREIIDDYATELNTLFKNVPYGGNKLSYNLFRSFN